MDYKISEMLPSYFKEHSLVPGIKVTTEQSNTNARNIAAIGAFAVSSPDQL